MDKFELLHEMIETERELSLKLFEIEKGIHQPQNPFVSVDEDCDEIGVSELLEMDVIISTYLDFYEQLCMYIDKKWIDTIDTLDYFGPKIIDIFELFEEIIKDTPYLHILKVYNYLTLEVEA